MSKAEINQDAKANDKEFRSSEFFQIGIVVKNIKDTLEFFRSVMEIGDVQEIDVSYPTAEYYGKVAGYRGKRAFLYFGPVQIELIELIDGKTIHEDFLKEKGEGLHHICFQVKDLETAKKKAAKAGLEVTQGYSRADGMGFAYLNSDKVGGVIFEIAQMPANSNPKDITATLKK